MQAKVIIERHTAPHQESHVLAIATEIRAAAIRQPGYVTGETLIDIDDHKAIVVVSTWRSMEEWHKWRDSEERANLEANMEQLLSRPPTMRECVDVGEEYN
jgi:heme-degrading monooxygenase HmoA